MLIAITACARETVRCRRGSVAIQIGLMLTVLLGMMALGTEVTFLLFKHRHMQTAADAAALGGATALSMGYPEDLTLEARAIAASMGFIHGVEGVTVAVYHPPISGTYAGNPEAVEVTISQPQTLALASLFRAELFHVGARAVAVQGRRSRYCVLALDPAATGAITIANNSVVTNPECGVAANSSSDAALILHNNAAINGPVSVHGGWSLANNAQLNGEPLIRNGPIVPDPYADIQLQPPPPCTTQSGSAGNNVTVNLNPGHFCNGWDYFNNVTVNLAPGAYYIDKKLSLKNNAVLNGTGVTLIINGDYEIDIANNATINITAPATGPYAGLAFFGRRDARPTSTQLFSNNTIMNITGAVYFPNQIVKFENNGSTTPNGCTQVIGRIVQIKNNVELDNDCDGTGVRPIGRTPSQLVE